MELFSSAGFVDFDACARGAERQTRVAFLSNLPQMSQLSANCPGGHERLPGSRRRDADESFICATSAAAEYPKELASRVVGIVLQSTQLSPASVPNSLSHVPVNAGGSTAMQKQPRGKVVPQLVPE